MYDILITVLRYVDIVYIIAYFVYLVDRRAFKFSIIQFFLLLLNRKFQKCKIFVPNTVKHVRVGISVPNNSRL